MNSFHWQTLMVEKVQKLKHLISILLVPDILPAVQSHNMHIHNIYLASLHRGCICHKGLPLFWNQCKLLHLKLRGIVKSRRSPTFYGCLINLLLTIFVNWSDQLELVILIWVHHRNHFLNVLVQFPLFERGWLVPCDIAAFSVSDMT